MKFKIIPALYFPSTVLFIDDSKNFLLNFRFIIEDDIPIKISNSPYLALKLLDSQYQRADLCSQVFNDSFFDDNYISINNDLIYKLDVSLIHWELFDSDRFNKISIVIIDYAMPGLNGLETLNRMKNLKVKKIMLTGKGDEKIAIQAFNSGLIDAFLKKQDRDIEYKLNKLIQDLQLKYFIEQSQGIFKTIKPNTLEHLNNRDFLQYFNETITKNNIVEYYLYDLRGSFLMLTKDGRLNLFLVRTKEDFINDESLLKKNGFSQESLLKVKSLQYIPFWRITSNPIYGENQYPSCTFSKVKKIIRTKELYISHITEMGVKIAKHDFLPFKNFIERKFEV